MIEAYHWVQYFIQYSSFEVKPVLKKLLGIIIVGFDVHQHQVPEKKWEQNGTVKFIDFSESITSCDSRWTSAAV
jgi:phosphoribosylformimino-5-aminoimidazole carboxamide ribonucleotide (ProFAR) isomerase